MINNLCKQAIESGGDIFPLITDSEFKTGLLNPSIFWDERQGKMLLNIRHVQYGLYHSENNQFFHSMWGPLAYVHPENDRTLTTVNYFGEFSNGEAKVSKVDTSMLDVTPIWEFVGLEDVRLVVWNDDIWMCGVRRDTTPNGQGRMEMSKIIFEDNKWREIERHRLETPIDRSSYCEKNWMPVNDKPFHFVKWSNPIELVEADLYEIYGNGNKATKQVFHSKNTLPFPRDLRGGSNVVKWGDGYMMLLHEVYLFKSELKQKDAFYYHRFVYLDSDFEVSKSSDYFNFMTGNVEFGTGLVLLNNGEVYISFGFQDNSAFILKTDKNFIDGLLKDKVYE